MADRVPDVPGGPHLRAVAMPRDANASGAVFGGWTLSQMDLAGGTFAARRAKARVATVGIEAMGFLRPVEVGDEVSCFCSLQRRRHVDRGQDRDLDARPRRRRGREGHGRRVHLRRRRRRRQAARTGRFW